MLRAGIIGKQVRGLCELVTVSGERFFAGKSRSATDIMQIPR